MKMSFKRFLEDDSEEKIDPVPEKVKITETKIVPNNDDKKDEKVEEDLNELRMRETITPNINVEDTNNEAFQNISLSYNGTGGDTIAEQPNFLTNLPTLDRQNTISFDPCEVGDDTPYFKLRYDQAAENNASQLAYNGQVYEKYNHK